MQNNKNEQKKHYLCRQHKEFPFLSNKFSIIVNHIHK
jgi:hypothetical protein